MKMPSGAVTPKATLVLLKNDEPLASVPLSLPAPDVHGVIDHTAQLPLDSLPVGDLVLRLVLKCAAGELNRDAHVRIE
jgi:hypothetical protein